MIKEPENPKEYEELIPLCCKFRTYKQHLDNLVLCWGITNLIIYRASNPHEYCKGCDFYIDINDIILFY